MNSPAPERPCGIVRVFASLPDEIASDIQDVIAERVRESPLMHYNTWLDDDDAYQCAYDLHLLTTLDDLWDCVKKAIKSGQAINEQGSFDQRTIRHFVFSLWPLLCTHPNAVIHQVLGCHDHRLDLLVDCDGSELDRNQLPELTPFQKEVRHARAIYS